MIILAILVIIAGLRQHNTQVVPTVEQAEHVVGVSLKNPAETAPIKTDVRHAVAVAKHEQDKNHSDVAPIVRCFMSWYNIGRQSNSLLFLFP